MASGYRIEWTDARGRYERELANVILPLGLERALSQGSQQDQPYPSQKSERTARAG